MTANAETILNSMGKDTTLTGRGDLWPLVLQKIGERPWLGYGYGAFWDGLKGESAAIWYASGWEPPNSHNGFLDMLLGLGWLGMLILASGFFIISFPRALVWVRQSKTSEGFWAAIYMIYLVLTNLGESTLMIQNDLFWLFYTAAHFSVLMPPERPQKMVQEYSRDNHFLSCKDEFTKEQVIPNS
jgi:O-antigen ligase